MAKISQGALLGAIEQALKQQRAFPSDVAHYLRRQLLPRGGHIYKRGRVAYVCAVRRKLRSADLIFSDSIQKLIVFVEKNPLISVRQLAEKWTAAFQDNS